MFGCFFIFLSVSFSLSICLPTLLLYGGIVEVDSVFFDNYYYCYYYYYFYLGSSTWI